MATRDLATCKGKPTSVVTRAAKGRDTRAPRAFLTGALTGIALLAASLFLHTFHHFVAAPFGHGIWDIAETVFISAMVLAFGIFALGRWRAFTRQTSKRKRAEEEFEIIFNLSPDMLFLCTPEGNSLEPILLVKGFWVIR
ncbi:MAG: hypothetical protein V3S20_11100 [Dehalococcoidia bacterium]